MIIANQVIAFDPLHRYWPGAFLTNAEMEREMQLEDRQDPSAHLLTVPVNTSLLGNSGAAGYVVRSWGAGWPCPESIPGCHATAVIHVPVDHQQIAWAALLVPRKPGSQELPPDNSFLRLFQDASARDIQAPVVTNLGGADSHRLVQLQRLGPGLVLRGRARVNATVSTHVGLGLYGMVPGFSVALLALSTLPF